MAVILLTEQADLAFFKSLSLKHLTVKVTDEVLSEPGQVVCTTIFDLLGLKYERTGLDFSFEIEIWLF